MTEREWNERFDAVLGAPASDAVRRARTLTLTALVVALRRCDAEDVAQALPVAEAPSPEDITTPEQLYAVLGRDAGLPEPQAREVAQAALRVAAEALSSALRGRARERLPSAWAELLHVQPPSSTGSPSAVPSASADRTLAGSDGRSGHGMSDASPWGAGAGQPGSVLDSDDPHADRRLSSARGISTARDGQTLADGRPGSRNPLSRGRS